MMGEPDQQTTKGPGPERQADAAPEVTVRPLQSTPDLVECVEVQRKIWGRDFADVVPASLLQVTQKVGGVAGGAFIEGEGRLVGFVYGLTGIRRSRCVHWSHMLGVLPEYRSRGIGQSLKRFQREWVRQRGVTEMLWTFDPLMAGNAHFNLNLLGVEIDSYEPQMYGDTGSDLHSFGTDRFVARWSVPPEEGNGIEGPGQDEGAGDEGALGAGGGPGREASAPAGVPLANFVPGGGGRPGREPDDAHGDRVRIEIPADILRIHRQDPDLARAWRVSTRTAFKRLFGEGYRIAGFSRTGETGRGVYILERAPGSRETDDA